MSSIYWASTSILSGFLMLSAYTYVFNSNTIQGVQALGFPKYFIMQLAVLKIIAAILLILPNIPIEIKEWSYAGAVYFIFTALVAHIVYKDSIAIILVLCFLLIDLGLSYYSFHKLT